jgi:hypothetical protein
MLAGESFWWPYLRVLPKRFNTPLYFDEQDKKFLTGCNLGYDETVEARRSAWNEEWSNGVSVLKAIGENVAGYTWYASIPLHAAKLGGTEISCARIGNCICGLRLCFLRDPFQESSHRGTITPRQSGAMMMAQLQRYFL